ncbi:hypothetical protein O3P69_012247 [Scylla paramamosain]|uniref:Chitin-binding type-2 domain-containing protein n=1 Tax=Scylla paramamosain TaxID=85552 RepID=A0AAW0TC93_SCYPA
MAPHLLISALLLLVCTGAYGDSRCQATHTCTNAGYFPRCPDFCDTQYFSCDATGNAGVLSTCPFGLVFDPDPTSHKCRATAPALTPPAKWASADHRAASRRCPPRQAEATTVTD